MDTDDGRRALFNRNPIGMRVSSAADEAAATVRRIHPRRIFI
jgi:hypothetical protein